VIDEVSSLLREVGSRVILPRFRQLQAHDIEEKSPAEPVTVADREAEQVIGSQLVQLLPGSRVLGEEACSLDPHLLDGIDEGLLWIVDPIDGTANFVAGTEPFATMVALLRDGEIAMSWIHEPVTGRMACAETGSGAWMDGVRLDAPAAPTRPERLAGIVSRFCLPEDRESFVGRVEQEAALVHPTRRCAGAEYPLIATGACDFALYWRTLVWDHAAGALLLREAGGVVRRLDGTDYRPGTPGVGLLPARSPEIAERLLRLC